MADEFDELKQNIGVRSTWVRFVYMLIFGLIFWVSEFLIGLVTILQFLHVLLTSRPNAELLRFGRSMAVFISEVIDFLTYNSEDMPFPFAPWPDGRKSRTASGAKPRKKATKKAPVEDAEDDSDSAGA